MIVNNLLNHLFTSQSTIAVLRELNQRVVGITGREIARSANITHRTALKTLENLEALKIVTKRVAGKSYYFTINRDKYIYKKILSVLLKREKEFKREIWNEIKKIEHENLISLIIFGSVARKEELIDSDLDLCVVYKKSKSEIKNKTRVISKKLYDEFGITLAPFYITQNQFKSKAKNHKPPVNNILKEGIVIFGKDLNRIKHD